MPKRQWLPEQGGYPIPAGTTVYARTGFEEFTSLVITPATLTLEEEADGEATVEAKDQAGHTFALPEDAEASSDDEGVATVELADGTLTITAVAEGTANITVASGSVTSNALVVTVTAPEP